MLGTALPRRDAAVVWGRRPSWPAPPPGHLQRQPEAQRASERRSVARRRDSAYVSLMVCAVFYPVELCDVFTSPSLKVALSPLRISLAAYSCIFAQVFTMTRARHLQENFRSLISMIDHFERTGVPRAKKAMLRSARRLRRLCAFYAAYSVILQFVMFLAFLVIDMSFPEAVASAITASGTGAAEDEATRGRVAFWLRSLEVFLLSSSSVFNNIAMHSLVVCLITLYAAFADVWECLGLSAEVGPCTRASLAVQANVIDVMLKMDAALFNMLPHLLVVTMVVPLLSTVQVVSGKSAELFSVGTAPLVFTFFMPLCLAGDSVAAARRGAMLRAYRGPWLDESPAQRRYRLGLMVTTQGRGGLVRGLGVGYLDRYAFAKAIKSWFSFLQVLLNLLK